ncbi:MAG: hypothetical protein R2911_36865 [Caldilineaceae bacterium]
MLHRNRYLMFVLILMLAVALAGCGSGASGSAEKISPATSENGTVVLTEKAAERLQVETAAVREEQIDGQTRLVVPYSALIYDNNGGTWIYTSPDALTYVRTEVTVDFIEGDMVVLTDGPGVGTEVATVAVAELYGTDTGVGK